MADEDNNYSRRLTSWKEIAAYLGKGVRTVQRWEQELALPVHRLEGKKRDIVHAYPEELDAWLHEHSHQLENNHADPTAPTPSPAAPATGRSQSSTPRQMPFGSAQDKPGGSVRVGAELPWLRVWGIRVAYASILLVLLFGARYAYESFMATPAGYRVEGRDLIVTDDSGRELWRHAFDFPLDEEAYKGIPAPVSRYPPSHLAALRDLDGDGRPELLFGVVPAEEHDSERKLICFDRKGAILWSFQPDRSVRYGDHRAPGDHHFEPPHSFGNFYLFPEGEEPPDAVWVKFIRIPWFASVVVKLNAKGELLGEYWHAGTVGVLTETTIAGRRVLLAGAVNNEHVSTSLSVLDYENPTGFSPATNPAYVCENCPAGAPLAYIVFPRSELSRVLDVYENLVSIRLFGGNTIQVTIHMHSEEVGDALLTTYYFDQDMRLRDFTLGPDYTTLHSRLVTMGLLDHELDVEKERAELSAPLYWTGENFSRDWTPTPQLEDEAR